MSEPIPAHLGDAGAELYSAAVEGFDLTIPESTALLQAAETLDVLNALENAIRETGPVLPTGKPSPLLVEARQQRAILVRLLGLLDLRDDDEEDRATATSRAARAAARKRWSRAKAGA
jgi:hypothetical protein